jgi:hypothetical protein
MDAIVDRLHKTELLLHSPAVKFVLVTTAEADRLRQARELIVEMESEKLKLSAIVINRFLDERTWIAAANASASPLEHLAEISELRNLLGNGVVNNRGVGQLVTYFEHYRSRALGDIERVASFAHELPVGVKLGIAPEIEAGIGDLAALSRIASFVTSGTSILKPLESAASRLRPTHPRLPSRTARS